MLPDKAKDIILKQVDFDPFADAALQEIPTTQPQREIWTNVQIGGHAANCSYNESVSLHLSGPFNFEFFKDAVHVLFRRHDALRSSFSEDGMQIKIADEIILEVPLIDIASIPASLQKAEIEKIIAAEAEHDFDLTNGPLGKISVLKLAKEKHQLILTFHHIVCDGWSLGIIMQDLGKIYSSLVQKISYNEPPAIQYSDFAKEEELYVEGDENRKVEEYWLNQYKGELPLLEMPINKVRPPSRTYNANRIDLEVDPVLIEQVKKTGAKQGLSFVATLISAFEIFLYRITGHEEIVVGLAAAGQAVEGKESVVGHCVNLLPLKSKVNAGDSFNTYLRTRKPEILDAYDNQRYTFGSLIQKLNIPRDPSRIPLVPVSFNVDLGITNGVEFVNCELNFTTNPRHYENFELFINAAGSGKNMTFECTYNTDLFDAEMISMRLGEFVELLKSIASDADLPVSKLNILTDLQKHKLFSEWQGKQVSYPQFNGLHELFEKSASAYADNVALVYENEKITYSELDHESNRLALFLQSKGIGPESTVAIFLERSPFMIVSILAILKAGAAYVPIDLSFPKDRIHHIIKDASVKLTITQKSLEQKFDELEQLLFVEDFKTLVSNNSVDKLNSRTSPSNLCYLIYTSGSTGKPKGVEITHQSALNYIQWCNDYYFNNKEYGNFGLYSSLSFDLTVTSIFCTLSRGKTLTIFNQQDEVSDILKYSFLKDSGIDVIKLTPAHILLLESLDIKSTGIKKAIVGGEELTSLHVEVLRNINQELEIINEYGPTEATVGCIVKNVITSGDAQSIGNPIANTNAYILDKNLEPLPPGIPGILFLGGKGLARGYRNNKEYTSQKFVTLNLNGDELNLYNSGDLAKFDLDGEIRFLGRIDNQVKIRGYRIELGDIESQLINHPSVKEQIVLTREDEPGNKKLVAYIVTHPGSELNQDELRNFLREALPEYMVPGTIVFLDEMPLTVNGKIDRKLLPEPDGTLLISSHTYEEPQTPVEEALANIWANVLNIDKAGRRDNFFELGGHSIIGVRMLNEVYKLLGVKLPLAALFRSPTIDELALQISKSENSKPWSPLVPLQSKGDKNPLFCIHMHNGNVHRWRVLVKHLGNGQPLYAIQPRGLDEKQEPHTTIEEMASYYLSQVKLIQPNGPYNLIGLCFSGMVVYEMAVLLQQQGEEVSFLGMVNNYAPPENPVIYKVKNELNKFMKMELGEKFNYALEKNINLGKKLFFKAKNILPGDNSELNDANSAVGFQQGHDLRTIHSVALLNYHPVHIYNGDLKIFRTADPIDSLYNEYLGWDRLIKGNIETTVIPGSDNDTIITDEPYNRILALKVREYLENVKLK